MKKDYVYENGKKLNTYYEDKIDCLNSNPKYALKYERIETYIENYSYLELTRKYETKTLDDKTKLKELKLDNIRVLHFYADGDTFVFLGTFIKRTAKTPPGQISKNNKRIKIYKESKKGAKHE